MPLPVTRPCDECGKPYVAKTKRSKYCCDTCRVRAHRRPSKTGAALTKAARPAQAAAPAAPGATVTQLPIAGGPLDQTSPADPNTEDVAGSLAAQVRKSLSEEQSLDTISGAQAIRIARQIDRGDDAGSAVATLSKELSRLVEAAKVEAAPRIKDAADDVMDRVAQKLSLVSS